MLTGDQGVAGSMFEVCALALIVGMMAGPILSALTFCGLAVVAMVLGAAYAVATGSSLVWVARHGVAIFISVQVGYGLGLAAWAAVSSRKRPRGSGEINRDKHVR